MCDYIASNTPLKYLCLADNNLNDEDVTLIARALKHNTNLEDLYLYDNDIREAGSNALCKAITTPQA